MIKKAFFLKQLSGKKGSSCSPAHPVVGEGDKPDMPVQGAPSDSGANHQHGVNTDDMQTGDLMEDFSLSNANC